MASRQHTPDEIEAITQQLQQRIGPNARRGGFLPRKNRSSLSSPAPDDHGAELNRSRTGVIDVDYRMALAARIDIQLLMIGSHHKIEAPVLKYIFDRLCEPRAPARAKRGRDALTLLGRNRSIVECVKWACAQGLDPTRNRATEAASGCSVVSAALKRLGIKVTERSVESIWGQRRSIDAQIYGPGVSSGDTWWPDGMDGPRPLVRKK